MMWCICFMASLGLFGRRQMQKAERAWVKVLGGRGGERLNASSVVSVVLGQECWVASF